MADHTAPFAPFSLPAMQRRAMGSVLVAIAILTLMDAAIKLLTATYGTPQILVMRYGAGTLVGAAICLFLLVRGQVGWPGRDMLKRSMMRASVIVTVAGLFFYSLSVIPLAEASAIAFTAPLHTAVLGRIILKEPIHSKAWLAILIGLVGVAIIASNAFTGDGAPSGELRGALSGYVAAAISSIGYALSLIMTRLHAARDPVPLMVMLQSGFSALFALPVLALVMLGYPIDGRAFVMPDQQTLALVLGIGFLGTVGHLFMAYGFKHAPASVLAPLEYTAFLWAVLYGVLFFAEMPTLRMLLGSALIVAGTMLVMRRGRRSANTPV